MVSSDPAFFLLREDLAPDDAGGVQPMSDLFCDPSELRLFEELPLCLSDAVFGRPSHLEFTLGTLAGSFLLDMPEPDGPLGPRVMPVSAFICAAYCSNADVDGSLSVRKLLKPLLLLVFVAFELVTEGSVGMEGEVGLIERSGIEAEGRVAAIACTG